MNKLYKLVEEDDVIFAPPQKPHVSFSYKAWEKIERYTRECSQEIGWFYMVSKVDDLTYIVHDAFAPKQSVSGTSVNFSSEQNAEAVDAAIAMGMHADLCESEVSGMLGFGHSHVNMPVHPSGTDTDYMQDLYREGGSFCVQTIHNKKGDVFVALYDFENKIFYDEDDVTWGMESVLTPDEHLDVTNQIDNARAVTPVPPFTAMRKVEW